MLLPYPDALAKLQRIFPDHIVTIENGDDNHESGVVETAQGESVASFELKFRSPEAAPLIR